MRTQGGQRKASKDVLAHWRRKGWRVGWDWLCWYTTREACVCVWTVDGSEANKRVHAEVHSSGERECFGQ